MKRNSKLNKDVVWSCVMRPCRVDETNNGIYKSTSNFMLALTIQGNYILHLYVSHPFKTYIKRLNLLYFNCTRIPYMPSSLTFVSITIFHN